MLKQILILASLSLLCSAWWEVGHMMTAQIAYQQLQQLNSTTFDRVTDLVTALNPLANELSQDFVQSAPWMDDIKEDSTDFWYNWHFYNRPVNPQGLFLTQNEDDAISNGVNCLQRAAEALKHDNGKNTMTKAVFMRMIIHVLGDLHQPLHSSELFNLTYPTGDLGGNLEYIYYTAQNTRQRLHSYFDAGAFYIQPSDDYLERPLNDSAKEFMDQWGKTLQQKYPRSYFADRLTLQEPYNWTQESWSIAQNQIYSYFSKTNKVSDEYQQIAAKICEEQIVIGGYRMADFIINVFNNAAANPFFQAEILEKKVAINQFQQSIMEMKDFVPLQNKQQQNQETTNRQFLKI